MRVLVLGDMEGTAGISRWDHVLWDKPLYEEGRRLYTGELSAAVRGAKQAGADEIIVADTHGAGGSRSFNSIIREDLEPGCKYCTQYHWLDFEDILKQGCQAVVIVGMHAMAGTVDGVLAHTVSYDNWMELSFNGMAVGETAILSATCAHYNCPVVFVSGDEAVCREAKALLGDQVTTAAVKRGINKFCAVHLHPEDSRRLIQEKVAEALQNIESVPLYKPQEPSMIEIHFTSPEIASAYQAPGVERSGPCAVRATAENWYTTWKTIY